MSSQVVFSKRGQKGALKTGFIELNRPKALNAINLDMYRSIERQLLLWSSDEEVASVVIWSASSRAFCAGGDVKALIRDSQFTKESPDGFDFFTLEYSVDHLIHNYSKPVICWCDGFTMGGGLGLINGASHRVVTEGSVFSMPEVSIGFFPDVGASYFLNQISYLGMGLLMGLTGARASGKILLEMELADYYIRANRREGCLEEISQLPWTGVVEEDKGLLTSFLRSQEGEAEDGDHFVLQFWKDHKDIWNQPELTEIDQFLNTFSPRNEYERSCQTIYKEGAPLSKAVFFEQMKRNKGMDISQVLFQDWTLAYHFCLEPNFGEGVRALLIDKDGNPKWSPRDLESIPPSMVSDFFKPDFSFDHPMKERVKNW